MIRSPVQPTRGERVSGQLVQVIHEALPSIWELCLSSMVLALHQIEDILWSPHRWHQVLLLWRTPTRDQSDCWRFPYYSSAQQPERFIFEWHTGAMMLHLKVLGSTNFKLTQSVMWPCSSEYGSFPEMISSNNTPKL